MKYENIIKFTDNYDESLLNKDYDYLKAYSIYLLSEYADKTLTKHMSSKHPTLFYKGDSPVISIRFKDHTTRSLSLYKYSDTEIEIYSMSRGQSLQTSFITKRKLTKTNLKNMILALNNILKSSLGVNPNE